MLTSGFFNKKYISIMFASLFGWLASLLGTLSDSILGGLFISEEAVSATGLVAPIFSLIMFVSVLFAVGTANKFSNYAGAFDRTNAKKVAGVGVITALICGVLFAAVMYFGEDAYFAFYGADTVIEELAREYYECFILYALANPVYWVMYYLVYEDGDANLILSVDMVAAFGNGLISVILVNKLGIKGLALGTIFALAINAFQLIPHFLSSKNSIGFSFGVDFKLLKEIVISGSTTSLGQLYIGVVDIVMNKYVIMAFGSEYLAAYAIVNLVINLTSAISCALDGAGAFIGVSYGENNTVFLKKALKKALKTALIVALCFTISIELLSGYMPYIYGIENPEAFEASVYAARIIPLFFVFYSLIVTWNGSFSKIGLSIFGNIVSCLSNLLMPLLLGVLIGNVFGFKGLVWGLGLSWPVTCAIASIIIIVTKGKECYPFGFKDTTNKIFIYEYKICDDEILELQNIIGSDLKSIKVKSSIISKIQLTLEETLEIVKEKNNKEVLGDCTIIVSDKLVSLTTRDNGIIFDITKESSNLGSLRDYVISSIIDDSLETKYLTTISFNRNNYVWEK